MTRTGGEDDGILHFAIFSELQIFGDRVVGKHGTIPFFFLPFLFSFSFSWFHISSSEEKKSKKSIQIHSFWSRF